MAVLRLVPPIGTIQNPFPEPVTLNTVFASPIIARKTCAQQFSPLPRCYYKSVTETICTGVSNP